MGKLVQSNAILHVSKYTVRPRSSAGAKWLWVQNTWWQPITPRCLHTDPETLGRAGDQLKHAPPPPFIAFSVIASGVFNLPWGFFAQPPTAGLEEALLPGTTRRIEKHDDVYIFVWLT